MSAPQVLVAYGSRRGSTAGLAEALGTALREQGLVVDVLPARRVRRVEGFDVVVLGGALYRGRWHRDARAFASRHAAVVRGRPVWLFSTGPLDRSADERDIPPVADAAQAGAMLGARGHVTFGGRLLPPARGFVARAMLRNGAGGDFRNLDRVRAWAKEIARDLQIP